MEIRDRWEEEKKVERESNKYDTWCYNKERDKEKN